MTSSDFYKTFSQQTLFHARSGSGQDSYYGVVVRGLTKTVVDKAIEIIKGYNPALNGQVDEAETETPQTGSAVLKCNVFHRFETGNHAYNSAIVWLECTSVNVLPKIQDLIWSYDPEVSGVIQHP